MRGLADMLRRLSLGEWEGSIGSSNAPNTGDGFIAELRLDDKVIGVAIHSMHDPRYSFELGVYPNEIFGGAYRTENAMLNAAAKRLLRSGQ